MKFILEINCDNAAFGDHEANTTECADEVARILRYAAGVLTRGSQVLRDINGNKVGGFEFSNDAPVCGF